MNGRGAQYFGFLLAFAAYGIGSYGYVLTKGWNISPRQWFSPLNPFVWASDGTPPLCVPPGMVIPNGQGGTQCGPASSTPASPTGANAANPAGGAVKSGAPQPGVQGVTAGGHGR